MKEKCTPDGARSCSGMQYELASEGVMWVMGRCYEIVGSNTDHPQRGRQLFKCPSCETEFR